MPDEKKTWWEQWGKAASALAVTAGLVAGIVTGAVRLSKLEARAEKVDDLMEAMQNLREVLLKNSIKWDPSEFPPIRPLAMSALPSPEGRTLDELEDLVEWCQAQVILLLGRLDGLEGRVLAMDRKIDPFPLQPLHPREDLRLMPPVLHLPSVDAGADGDADAGAE